MVPAHVVLGHRTLRFSLPYLLPFLPVEPISDIYGTDDRLEVTFKSEGNCCYLDS
jgi:hypothetical protein